MSKNFTKDDVIQNKKQAIKHLNSLLEKYINDSSFTHLKKANLISYWIDSYSTYLSREENFDPKRLISYKRGDVIKVDFGFNIGSEHGGLHYAIVLDNDNKHSSPVITVLPLSSGTEAETYERDLYLGNELYSKVTANHKLLLSSATQRLQQCNELIQALSKSTDEKVPSIIAELKGQATQIISDIHLLNKYKQEIEHMKQGSIAMMEQITTISKIRIYVPRKSNDILYGISFSASAMTKINAQLINLFIGNTNPQ